LTDGRHELTKALEHSASDLDSWVQKRDLSVDELCQMLIRIMRENGFAARMILDKTRRYIPLSVDHEVTPDGMIKALEAIRSKRIGTAIPEGESPSLELQSGLEQNIRDALPNLRRDLLKIAKTGPQRRRGGRPEEVDDPELRYQIREKIKARRDADSTLSSIFKKLATEYGVSSTTIKRVWLEKGRK
jgi:KaiC/GvpD/RAD55 family RecA-like ATPase